MKISNPWQSEKSTKSVLAERFRWWKPHRWKAIWVEQGGAVKNFGRVSSSDSWDAAATSNNIAIGVYFQKCSFRCRTGGQHKTFTIRTPIRFVLSGGVFQSRTIHALTMIHIYIYVENWNGLVWYRYVCYSLWYRYVSYNLWYSYVRDRYVCYRYVSMGQLCYACNVNVGFMRCHVNQCNVIEPKICV